MRRGKRGEGGSDDAILAEATASGRTDAFEQLVLRYQDSVFNVIFRIVENREEARDISQETFLKAYARINSYNPRFPFKSWVLRIGVNSAIDHLRRKPRGVETVTAGMCTPGCAESVLELKVLREFLCHEDERFDPEAHVMRNEEVQRLMAAFSGLPANHRAVLVLYHAEEMSYSEISKLMGVSKNTVKTWARRGRIALARALESGS